MNTIAQTIIDASSTLAVAAKSAVEEKTDLFITSGEMKAVYEFKDDSLLILDFGNQRMIAA